MGVTAVTPAVLQAAADMAFYVMHDTFICQKQPPRTNYVLNNSKYNEQRKKWCEPKIYFHNDKTNEPIDIRKNLTDEHLEQFRIMTKAEVGDNQTITARPKADQSNELTDSVKEKSRTVTKYLVGNNNKLELNKDLGEDSKYNFVAEKLPEINHTGDEVSNTNSNLDNSSFVAEGKIHFELNTFELDKKLEIENKKLIFKDDVINSSGNICKNVETTQMKDKMKDEIKKRNERKLTKRENKNTKKQSRNTKIKEEENDQHPVTIKQSVNHSQKGKFTPLKNEEPKSNKQIQIEQSPTLKKICMDPIKMHDTKVDCADKKMIKDKQISGNIQETHKLCNTYKDPNKKTMDEPKIKDIGRIIQKEYDKYRKIILQKKVKEYKSEEVTAKLKSIEIYEIKSDIERYKVPIEKKEENGLNSSNMSGSDDVSLAFDDSPLYWIFLAVSWLPAFCLLSWVFSLSQIVLCI